MKKIIKWLDNFWYHYKWETLIIAFFGTFIIIATTQLLTKDKIDASLIYTGPAYFSARDVSEVESAFEQAMRDDYNGDGEKGIEFTDVTLMTEQQALDAQSESKQDDDPSNNVVINVQDMREAEKKFNMQVFAGEVIICMLDPYWYDELVEAQGLAKLTDVLGYQPEGAIDDYGVYLKDTKFGKFYNVFSYLPDDTILCIRTISTVSAFKNKTKEQARYDCNVEVFRDVIEFEYPEGYIPPEEADAAS